MRKLKLQMQLSLDGYVAGPNGEMDWMTWEIDEDLKAYINSIIDSSDTILLGRKMTDGFMAYWEKILKDGKDDPEYEFAKKMIETPKIVFSKTLTTSRWKNTTLATGDLKEEINALKNKNGKDLLVYGGAKFASSLIKNELFDEFHFLINPVIIGKGMPIFESIELNQNLSLISATAYSCGITVLCYQLKKQQSFIIKIVVTYNGESLILYKKLGCIESELK